MRAVICIMEHPGNKCEFKMYIQYPNIQWWSYNEWLPLANAFLLFSICNSYSMHPEILGYNAQCATLLCACGLCVVFQMVFGVFMFSGMNMCSMFFIEFINTETSLHYTSKTCRYISFSISSFLCAHRNCQVMSCFIISRMTQLQPYNQLCIIYFLVQVWNARASWNWKCGFFSFPEFVG